MFKLMHEGESIGSSNLESGDPETLSVSGVFNNVGGAKALAGWIGSIGGSEEDGVVYIVLNEDFALQDGEAQPVNFGAGTLIAVPGEDETFLELTGLSSQDYQNHFPGHQAALAEE